MNSQFGNLFLSLQALIAALADGSGNKYFPYVDQDLGQLEAVDNMGRYPVSWPCVLIDIDEMSFATNGMNTQQGSGKICLRMGFPAYSSTSNITPEEYRQKALYYYDLEQVLHLALQGVVPSYTVSGTDVLGNVFGHYDRLHARTERYYEHRLFKQERRDDSNKVRIRQLTYTLGMNDYTTQDQVTYVPVAIDLSDVIVVNQ